MNTTKELLAVLKTVIANFNIAKVAEASGVGEQTIRNWLSGKTGEPALGSLIAVFQSCGHPIKFSFEGLR